MCWRDQAVFVSSQQEVRNSPIVACLKSSFFSVTVQPGSWKEYMECIMVHLLMSALGVV